MQSDYDADLTLVDLNESFELKKEDLFYRHQHSPYIGMTFKGKVKTTVVGGKVVFENGQILYKVKFRGVDECERCNTSQIAHLVDWLGEFGKDSEGGVTRLLYTKEWVEGTESTGKIMQDDGLSTHLTKSEIYLDD